MAACCGAKRAPLDFGPSAKFHSSPVGARGKGSGIKQLVEFPLQDGGSVIVQVEDQPGGAVTRGLGRNGSALAERTDKTFEEATNAVMPAAHSLIARLRAIEDPPDEIALEFGVQLSAQAGAFIASIAAEANFKVTMTWKASPADLDPPAK